MCSRGDLRGRDISRHRELAGQNLNLINIHDGRGQLNKR